MGHVVIHHIGEARTRGGVRRRFIGAAKSCLVIEQGRLGLCPQERQRQKRYSNAQQPRAPFYRFSSHNCRRSVSTACPTFHRVFHRMTYVYSSSASVRIKESPVASRVRGSP